MQKVKNELGDRIGYGDLSRQARLAKGFSSVVDVNDPVFLAPQSMILAIKDFCKNTQQPEPSSPGELAKCVYQSLSRCYADTAIEIEGLTGRAYSTIHIVGGGCQDRYLNELTARSTGKDVVTGPVEATAIGNILAQMIHAGVVETVQEARRMVSNSFDIERLK
jgi:rhamnulokinase